MTTGDLFAAWRTSGAPTVVGASVFAPSNLMSRVAMLGLGAVLRVPGAAGLATRQLARVRTTKAKERPRDATWGHARVEWPSGRVREGWMRADDAMDFTSAALVEVALRLARLCAPRALAERGPSVFHW